MAEENFVHLHVHTDASLLDGLARPDGLAARAAALGMPAIAVTDHGTLSGALAVSRAAKNHGIHGIIGVEAYVAPSSRTNRSPEFFAGPDRRGDDVSGNGAYTHMTLWAESPEGLKNLMRLTTQANVDGFYQKPRIDRELLAQHGKGLIGTTGCVSGEVQTLLRLGQYDRAVAAAAEMRDILGEGNLYAEIMDHNIGIEQRTIRDLLRLAKDLGLPLVATNDSHYVSAEDYDAHDHLLAIGTKARVSDEKRFRFDGNTFYLRSASEMRDLFAGDLAVACDNTLLIAERCSGVEFASGESLMPVFPAPDGHTDVTYLRETVQEGLRERLGHVNAEYQERADYELSIIEQMGFSSYFLIVADVMRWARESGIATGPARGSAGGSLIAWATRITNIDPIAHDLYFERFLNPDRISMPDIDMDFDDRRRDEVIAYTIEKYGADYAAQIITFNTVKARSAVKDIARVAGMLPSEADALTKKFPKDVMGKSLSLAGAFDPSNPRYREAAEFREDASTPEWAPVIDMALRIEGVRRSAGIHAAAVVIGKNPLTDNVPLQRSADGTRMVTAFDGGECESVGLLKMDYLGLQNLSTITDALALINRNHGIGLTLDSIVEGDLSDPAVYRLLQEGHTLGVFQLDSSPMQALLRRMRPDNFGDISAVLALYRPGPMGANAHNDYADRKNGRQAITPIHPELAEVLEPILSHTYGLIIYQESVMRIAQDVAGYTLAQADLLRRAMGKKKKEILDKEYVPFRDGARANGYSDAAIQALWDILVPFADYSFNKAHSAGYGLISYATAYLKAHYPAEFMAAVLTSAAVGAKAATKLPSYINECKRMGLPILPPSVNHSLGEFSVADGGIRFGLQCLTDVGEGAAEAIVAEREENGPYAGFRDFVQRSLDHTAINKKAVSALIETGAFDEFSEFTRSTLAAALPGLYDNEVKAAKKLLRPKTVDDVDALFALDDIPTSNANSPIMTWQPKHLDEWPTLELLTREKHFTRMYISGHPLDEYAHGLRAMHLTSIADIVASSRDEDDENEEEALYADGDKVVIAGFVQSVEWKPTRSGGKWALFTVDGVDGSVEVKVFGKAALVNADLLNAANAAGGVYVKVEGVLSEFRGELSVAANTITRLSLSDVSEAARATQPFTITVSKAVWEDPRFGVGLAEVIGKNRGKARVHVQIHETGEKFELAPEFTVLSSSALTAALEGLIVSL